MVRTSKLSTDLSGLSGEYFVAAELSRRGYIASLTLRNARGIDILAANSNASKSVGIQVKTNQSSQREWILHRKVEMGAAENLFFIFVNLNGAGALPTYHIVPSIVVAERCRSSHQWWLAAPGKGGRAHKDTTVRKFSDLEGNYLGQWRLLGLDNAI